MWVKAVWKGGGKWPEVPRPAGPGPCLVVGCGEAGREARVRSGGTALIPRPTVVSRARAAAASVVRRPQPKGECR